MAAVAPQPQSVSQIKSKLLNPATTSHFSIFLGLPRDEADFRQYMAENNLALNQDRLQLMCSEATLPGSSLATTELTNDRSGVTERHAYRRIYQDRIDLTFYCDAEQYMPIRFFESWIKFIMNETGDLKNETYAYRVKFPAQYKGDLEVTKFEKNINQRTSVRPLTYKFVNIFPVAISAMPVSYDASSLLKCSVSLNYTRYFISNDNYDTPPGLNPFNQAARNSFNLNQAINAGIPNSDIAAASAQYNATRAAISPQARARGVEAAAVSLGGQFADSPRTF